MAATTIGKMEGVTATAERGRLPLRAHRRVDLSACQAAPLIFQTARPPGPPELPPYELASPVTLGTWTATVTAWDVSEFDGGS